MIKTKAYGNTYVVSEESEKEMRSIINKENMASDLTIRLLTIENNLIERINLVIFKLFDKGILSEEIAADVISINMKKQMKMICKLYGIEMEQAIELCNNFQMEAV